MCYTIILPIFHANSKYISFKKIHWMKMKSRYFFGIVSQALPPIFAVTKGLKSFAYYCRNRYEGLDHGDVKVSGLHYGPVDYFKSYILRISMKIVKIWCIVHFCCTIFNLKWFPGGFLRTLQPINTFLLRLSSMNYFTRSGILHSLWLLHCSVVITTV